MEVFMLLINLIKYIKITIIPPIIIINIMKENQWSLIVRLILKEVRISKINKIVIIINGWVFLLWEGNEWIMIINNEFIINK